MKDSRINVFLLAPVLIALLGLLVHSLGIASKEPPQESKKSLNIQRHASEPFELIDIKVGEQSVKNKIRLKSRTGDEGLDRLEFAGENDWLKRLRIRLRNVSGRTILGFQAYLYLKPQSSRILFSVSLKGAARLESTLLQPTDEIEIRIDDGSLSRTVNNLQQHALEATSGEVTLSVENVAFSDGSLWDGGQLLRKDPEHPLRWIPDKPKRPPGGKLNHTSRSRSGAAVLLSDVPQTLPPNLFPGPGGARQLQALNGL